MAKKNTHKLSDPLPKWKKRRGSWTYEIIDPIAGGLWVYCAKRKMSNAQLTQRILDLLFYGRAERPKRGQVSMLRVHGDD